MTGKGYKLPHRLVSIFMAVLLFISLLGCTTNKGNPADTSGSKDSTTQGAATTASDSTPKTLEIGLIPEMLVEKYETNYFTKMIEKDLNVSLKFNLLPSNIKEAQTKLSLLVSSGSVLSDVLLMYLPDATILDYASKGVLLKLNDYYKNPELAANFMKINEADRTYIYNNQKDTDGNIYSMGQYCPSEWDMGSERNWINEKWLQKLNLQAPKTTDELTAVLKAFVNNDPNGNNKKDEIGMVGAHGGWSTSPVAFLMNAFTYTDPVKARFAVNNGKIEASFIKPEWKQGLEYMAMLVREGLLSPLSFTQDTTQLKALINVEGGMAGVVSSGSYSVFAKDVLKYDMALLGPVAGPNGVRLTSFYPTLPRANFFITKDCKDPEFAFSFGDYMCSYDASNVNRYGELGVDWSNDPAVCAEWMGIFEKSQGIKPTVAILNESLWGNLQNKHWVNSGPSYLSLEASTQVATIKKSDAVDTSVPDFDSYYHELYVPCFPKEPISKLLYTNEELGEIASIKTTVDEYVSSSVVEFVTGSKPLTQWDNYLKELDKMGLQKYVEYTQKAYDRVVKNN